MKKTNVFIIVGILAILLIGTIIAETETTVDAPFSLKSWFTHTFGIQQFSVVGDSQLCSQTPSPLFGDKSVPAGSRYSAKASDYCSSGYGLFDVYSPNWNPYKEYANSIDILCGGSGLCNVELYCCYHPECSSDSDCQSWVGEYSTCKTASCIVSNNYSISKNSGYKCTTDYGTETDIPYCKSSFKYCSANTHKDCYYVSGSSCLKHTYPGVTTCPTSYAGNTLYSSLSACQANICTPTTCSALGKQCGTTSDGCGKTLTCGTCGAGTTCNSNGYCQSDTITEVPCETANIDIIDIPCSINLDNCNSACPVNYIAGTVDSCGFHDCIAINQTEPTYSCTTDSYCLEFGGGGKFNKCANGYCTYLTSEEEKPIFDLNSQIFQIGSFKVTFLMLIIGVIFLIILMNLLPRK